MCPGGMPRDPPEGKAFTRGWPDDEHDPTALGESRAHGLACPRRLPPPGPDLFFPVSTSGASLPQIETARRICERCPVLTACLRWALDAGQVSGIWGGTTEEERRAMRHAPAPAPR